ncbi:MAG: T9SS type A sorting domain-containing protein [Phycisphaerae bacterium]|nr:T9SS type A sorting domain-containing protein [Saprospiraceae bacterium]
MRTLFYCLLALLLSPAPSFSQQTLEDTILSDGIQRSFRIHIPATYSGQTPVPLVFMLHGWPMTAFEMEQFTGFDAVSDTANFILVYPNGSVWPAGKFYWNVYPVNEMSEVNFISRLIDTLTLHYNIDPNRIYASGASNGGFMCYELACKLSNRIAAVASVVGSTMLSSMQACNPPRPVPIMEIHGTDDPSVSYYGGNFYSYGLIPSTEVLVNHWVTHNNCTQTPITTPIPDLDATDGCTAERYLYAGGNGGSTVELIKVTGGGHQWSGGLALPASYGKMCNDFSANQEVWRFLSQYRLDDLSAALEPQTIFKWIVYPNPTTDYITIEADPAIGITQIVIYDVFGRLLKSPQAVLVDDGFRVDLSEIARGVYFFSVKTGKQKVLLPILKQ